MNKFGNCPPVRKAGRAERKVELTMFEFATRWLVCLVLLAVVVQSERTIKGIYQKIASELAWCLGFNENYSKCYEMNGE